SVILAAGGAPAGTSYATIWDTPTSQYAEGHSPQALLDNLEHTRVFLSTGNGVNCPSDPVGTPDGFLLDSGTEAFIAVQQSLFELSLRGAGIDVEAHTTCGRHTFGVWDRAWDVAERWGFFGTAEADVDDWTYRTIQDQGVMWGIAYDFAEPPPSVVRFSQAGDRLSGSGAGTVTLTDADGCGAELTLPF